MAKGKYEYWLTDDGLTLLRDWARAGLTDEELTVEIGINRTTLYDWKRRFPDISDALKKGKRVVDAVAEERLLDLVEAGNIAAIIFWLKNRRPDLWTDKKVSEEENVPFEISVRVVDDDGD